MAHPGFSVHRWGADAHRRDREESFEEYQKERKVTAVREFRDLLRETRYGASSNPT